MDMISVSLLDNTKLKNVIVGARVCHDSFDKNDYLSENYIGDNNIDLLKRLIKLEHFSIFEHLYYTFYIENISRLCLIELTRHRMASYSVQSTRYTLKKLINKIEYMLSPFEVVKEFTVVPPEFTKEDMLQVYYIIENLVEKAKIMKNDELKYYLPESWRTKLVFTINARSLRNFLSLRSSNNAHFEIRYLANLIFNKIPETHKFIFEDCIR